MSSKHKVKHGSSDKQKTKSSLSPEKAGRSTLSTESSTSADKLNGDPSYDKYAWREEDDFPPPPLGKDRKRLVHNIVEKKRKDKIKTWINTIGDLLPSYLFLGTEKNTVTTLEKTVDYLRDLQHKNELLLHDKGSQVQAEEISRLEKQVDDLQGLNERYEGMLRDAGIGFALESGGTWKTRGNSSVQNAASSDVSTCSVGMLSGGDIKCETITRPQKGTENINKTAADSTSENIDDETLSVKTEVKTEGAKKKRVRNRSNLLSAQVKDQSNHANSPTVLPPGATHGNQDMLGAAMNAASIGMAGQNTLGFSAPNTVMYGANQMIAPPNSSVTNVNQMLMPASLGGNNQFLVPPSGIVNVMNPNMQGVPQNGFVYMQPGTNQVAQTYGSESMTVTPGGGGLLQVAPNTGASGNTNDLQTNPNAQNSDAGTIGGASVSNQNIYGQNAALQTLASIATSNHGNNSNTAMQPMVLPQSSVPPNTVTTVTQALNSSVPIMSSSTNQNAMNSSVQGLNSASGMSVIQTGNTGANQNLAMNMMSGQGGSFIIQNGQLVFVQDSSSMLMSAPQQSSVTSTQQPSLTPGVVPGGVTPQQSAPQQRGDAAPDGQTGQLPQGGGEDSSVQSVDSLASGSVTVCAASMTTGGQANITQGSMIGQSQTIIRPTQSANQSQMPLYSNQQQLGSVPQNVQTSQNMPRPLTINPQSGIAVQSQPGQSVVQTSQASGFITVNTVPSQPNQLPSALILPNGQIVPVVTQPSLLFQPGTSTAATPGIQTGNVATNVVVTPGGQVIQQTQLAGSGLNRATPTMTGMGQSGQSLNRATPTMTGMGQSGQSFVFPAQPPAQPSSTDILAPSFNLAAGGTQPPMQQQVLSTHTALTTAKSAAAVTSAPAGMGVTGSPSMNQFGNQSTAVQMNQASTAKGGNFNNQGGLLPNSAMPPGMMPLPPASTPSQTVHHLPQTMHANLQSNTNIGLTANAAAPLSVVGTSTTSTLTSNVTASANMNQPVLGNGTILLVDANGVPIGTIPAGQALPTAGPALPPPSATSKKPLKKSNQRILMPKPPSLSSSASGSQVSSFAFPGLQPNSVTSLQTPTPSLWNTPVFTPITDTNNSADALANQNKSGSSSSMSSSSSSSVTMTTVTASNTNSDSSTQSTTASKSVAQTSVVSMATTTSACTVATDILAQAAESIFSSMSEISPQMGDYCTADDENALHIDTSVGDVEEPHSPAPSGNKTEEKKPESKDPGDLHKTGSSDSSVQKRVDNRSADDMTSLFSGQDASHEMSDLIIDTGDPDTSADTAVCQEKGILAVQTKQQQHTVHHIPQPVTQSTNQMPPHTQPGAASANQMPLHTQPNPGQTPVSLNPQFVMNQMPLQNQTMPGSHPGAAEPNQMTSQGQTSMGRPISGTNPQSVQEDNERLQQTLQLMQQVQPPLVVQSGNSVSQPPQTADNTVTSIGSSKPRVEEGKKKTSSKSRKSSNSASDTGAPSQKTNKKKSHKKTSAVPPTTPQPPPPPPPPQPPVSDPSAVPPDASTTTPRPPVPPPPPPASDPSAAASSDASNNRPEDFLPDTITFTESELSQVLDQVESLGQSLQIVESQVEGQSVNAAEVTNPLHIEETVAAQTQMTAESQAPLQSLGEGQGHMQNESQGQNQMSSPVQAHPVKEKDVKKSRSRKSKSSQNIGDQPAVKRKKKNNTGETSTPQVYTSQIMIEGFSAVLDETPDNSSQSVQEQAKSNVKKDGGSSEKTTSYDGDSEKQNTSSLHMDLLLNFESAVAQDNSDVAMEIDKKEAQLSSSASVMDMTASPLSTSASPLHQAPLASPVLSSPEPVLTIITGDMPPSSAPGNLPQLSPHKPMYPPVSTNVPISNKKLAMHSPPGRSPGPVQVSPPAGRHQSMQASPVHSSLSPHKSANRSPAKSGLQSSPHQTLLLSPGGSAQQMQDSPTNRTVLPSSDGMPQRMQDSPSGRSIFDSVRSMASTSSASPQLDSKAMITSSSPDIYSQNLSLLSKMANSPSTLSTPPSSLSPADNRIKSRELKETSPNNGASLITAVTTSPNSVTSDPILTSPGQSRRNRSKTTQNKDEGRRQKQAQCKAELPSGGSKLNPTYGSFVPGDHHPVNLSSAKQELEHDMRMMNSGMMPPHLSMLAQNNHLMQSRGPYPVAPGDGVRPPYPAPHLSYSAQSLFSNQLKNHSSQHQGAPHPGLGAPAIDQRQTASSPNPYQRQTGSSPVPYPRQTAGSPGPYQRQSTCSPLPYQRQSATSPAPLQHRPNFYLSDSLASPHGDLRSPYSSLHQKDRVTDRVMSPPNGGGISGGLGMPRMHEGLNIPRFSASSSSAPTSSGGSAASSSVAASTGSFTFSLSSSATTTTTTTVSTSAPSQMSAHHHPHQFPFFPLHPSFAPHGAPPHSVHRPGGAGMPAGCGFDLSRDDQNLSSMPRHPPPPLQPSPSSSSSRLSQQQQQRPVLPPSGQNQNMRHRTNQERLSSPPSLPSHAQNRNPEVYSAFSPEETPANLKTGHRDAGPIMERVGLSHPPRDLGRANQPATLSEVSQAPREEQHVITTDGRHGMPAVSPMGEIGHPQRERRHRGQIPPAMIEVGQASRDNRHGLPPPAPSLTEVKQTSPSVNLPPSESRSNLQQRTAGCSQSQNAPAQRSRSGSVPRSPHLNSEMGPFYNPPSFPSPGSVSMSSPSLHHPVRLTEQRMPPPEGAAQRNPNFDGRFATPEVPGMPPFNATNFEPPPPLLQVTRTTTSTTQTSTFPTNQSANTSRTSSAANQNRASTKSSKPKSSKSKKKASASSAGSGSSGYQGNKPCEVDTNLSNSIFESTRSMTPFFPIGSMSPPPAARGLQGDGPTYIPGNLFTNPSRPLSNSAATQHKGAPDMNAPFNQLFQSSRSQSSLGLNFQPPHGFAMNHMHAPGNHHTSSASMTTPHSNSVAVTPHVPSFSLTNIFQDMNNPAGVQGDALNISPIKFHHANPMLPPQPGMDHNALQHHHHQSAAIYHNRPHPPPVIHNAMGINSLLGHQHHGFEPRGMGPGMNGAMGPPFHGHAHTPSFGMPTLNFMHDH